MKKILNKYDVDVIKGKKGGKGSEAKLVQRQADNTVAMMRLQHQCCKGNSSVVWEDYVAKIRRTFGIPRSEFD